MVAAGAGAVALLVASLGEAAGGGAVSRSLRGLPANATAQVPEGVAERTTAASHAASTIRNATLAAAVGKRGGTEDVASRASPRKDVAGLVAQGPSNETRHSGASAARGGRCLCLFDIDRTLTGRQGDTCGGSSKVVHGVWDPAYGGGTLTLSALGRAGIGSTFCGACEIGVVSRGTGGGRDMRGVISGSVLGGRAGSHWSGPEASSPLVVRCHDRRKASCAAGILDWYGRHGKEIPRSQVYHFDDKASSVSSFQGTGMNAIQVSCQSRAGSHGGCGASPGEVERRTGVHHCR